MVAIAADCVMDSPDSSALADALDWKGLAVGVGREECDSRPGGTLVP